MTTRSSRRDHRRPRTIRRSRMRRKPSGAPFVGSMGGAVRWRDRVATAKSMQRAARRLVPDAPRCRCGPIIRIRGSRLARSRRQLPVNSRYAGCINAAGPIGANSDGRLNESARIRFVD
jgi:hypothetical protein